MNATFRLKRSYSRIGLVGALFFAVMAVMSVLGIYFEAPVERRDAALAFGLVLGGFWLVWAALSIWILLAYWRQRLTIRDEQIDYQGVVRRKRMRLSEITNARWRCWPAGGSLVLEANLVRLAVDLGNYEPEEQRQLIRFFRESLPPPLQSRWEQFYVRIVKRQARHARHLQKTEPGKGEALLTRRRLDCYCLPVFVVACGASFYAFRLSGQYRFLLLPLGFIPIWLLLRFGTPRKGMVAKRISAATMRFLAFLLVWTAVGIASVLVLEGLGLELRWMHVVLSLALWVAVVLAGAAIADRPRRREEQEAVEEARRRGQVVPEELRELWAR